MLSLSSLSFSLLFSQIAWHRSQFPVDFGLGFFALANAGVKLDGTIGAMAGLIILSLIIGKTLGVVLMYKLTKRLGYPAPFGVRGRHVRMIGLIASMSLTVSLFVADIAFDDGASKVKLTYKPFRLDRLTIPFGNDLTVSRLTSTQPPNRTTESVKGDCKIGALLSAFVGVLCWILSHFDNFREEDVVEEVSRADNTTPSTTANQPTDQPT